MTRQVSNWLQTYMSYTLPLEAPDKFHFWTGVSVIAGALRRRVWLDMGMFTWYPNFYIVFVAPPGIVSKSTTLSVGMHLLREVKDIHFGPDAVTWPALTNALAASRIDYPIGDTGLVAMSCITIAASEFGTFLNPNDREMIDVLVDLWDSRIGSWEKRTKTSGNDQIINPWINLAACTTPGWIAGNFPEYLIGGGFTSRCVFIFADEKRRLVPYPSTELPSDFLEMQAALKHDLQEIALMQGPFQMSPEAREFGEAWYRDHYTRVNRALDNSQFAGYLARKQTHIHKLAMVLSASSSDSLIIDLEHIVHAEGIITSLEDDMPLVFSHIGSAGDAKNTIMLLDILKAQHKVPKRELYRMTASKVSWLEFMNAMEGVTAAGWARLVQEGEELYYVYIPDEVKGNVEVERAAWQEAYGSGTSSG